jgi:hypothetical protein
MTASASAMVVLFQNNSGLRSISGEAAVLIYFTCVRIGLSFSPLLS